MAKPRFKPTAMEIISIAVAIVLYSMVYTRSSRERLGYAVTVAILITGNIFAFIAWKLQWDSIRAARKQVREEAKHED